MQSSQGFRPPIILLKEGTDTSQGRGQLVSNINATMAIVEIVRTTLGRKLRRKGGRVGLNNVLNTSLPL